MLPTLVGALRSVDGTMYLSSGSSIKLACQLDLSLDDAEWLVFAQLAPTSLSCVSALPPAQLVRSLGLCVLRCLTNCVSLLQPRYEAKRF